ncbi:hypothetical protein J6590_056030 [Homalodisca vitripennis]|nr:hypothetical protein J6590_092773 [Homalodisca vitripennis]KAG8301337.1 hypothetical protein J6590_056030 [Homalodisca vitripennis]
MTIALRITNLPPSFTYQELEMVVQNCVGRRTMELLEMFIDHLRTNAAYIICRAKVVAETIFYLGNAERVRGFSLKVEYCTSPPNYLLLRSFKRGG